MKILFLSNVMGVGGTDRQIKYIAEELDQRGHDIKIVSLRPLRDMGKKARADGLDATSVDISNKFSVIGGMSQLIRITKTYDPDVLCCFLFHSNMLGRAIGNLLRVPIIITSLRNEDIGGQFREPITKLTNRLDDAVVTNSSTVGNSLIDKGVFSKEHHRTIHNCIDTNQFSPDVGDRETVRSELNISEENFLWITVGRLNPQKDHKNLLHALSNLEREDVSTVIIGGGMYREDLESISLQEDINDNVQFLGEREDIPRLLTAADAFVLPSRWEGLPNVVMEALSCEVPVVSTDVGGIKELISDGETGLLVPTNDPVSLQEAMSEMMHKDSAERKEMGKIGRQNMVVNFSIETIADEWIDLYRECMPS